jgi:uncharacterized membrane protein YkoI
MKPYTTLLACIVLLTGTTLAHADDDHERAKRLREAGDILPLETILQKAREVQPGTILEVELETEHGQLAYEIELLTDQGKVMKLTFDANTGKVIKTKSEH